MTNTDGRADDRITDEAVEAAAQAIWQVRPLTRENIRAATRRALRVAAPHILNRNDEDAEFYEKGRPVIPEAAVEAAANVLDPRTMGSGGALAEKFKAETRAEARRILEAAAPHIRAQTADLIADGMQAWAGDSERAYVQGFAEAAWGKVTE